MEPVYVLSTVKFEKELLAKIRAASPRIALTQHTTPDAAHVPAGAFEQAEVIYTFSALPHPDQAPRLCWVQLNSAGANHVLKHPLFATDVVFTTNSGLHAINIGEYVLASILAWTRKLPELFDLQRKREWPSDRWTRYAPSELRGATIGIVGYGSIGREVGRLAKAFGMRVLAAKRRAESPGEQDAYKVNGVGDPDGALPDALYSPEQLREMLADCDYVVLAVPLTRETRGMIGEEEQRAVDIFCENLRRYVAGQPLLNIVDKATGY